MKRTILACHRMTVSISATCQRCLDTINLSFCARAQLYKLDTNQRTSRRFLSLINKTAIISTVIVTRSTHVSRGTNFPVGFFDRALVVPLGTYGIPCWCVQNAGLSGLNV